MIFMQTKSRQMSYKTPIISLHLGVLYIYYNVHTLHYKYHDLLKYMKKRAVSTDTALFSLFIKFQPESSEPLPCQYVPKADPHQYGRNDHKLQSEHR